MTTAIARQISSIKKSAEAIVSSEPAVIGSCAPGDVVRQGDLYLIALDTTPAGEPQESRQLAPGTTQGSRHIAEGDCEILTVNARDVAAQVNRLVRGANVPEELVGPAIVCRGPVEVTHPEHGNRTLPDGTSWVVVYQRQFGEEIRRIRD